MSERNFCRRWKKWASFRDWLALALFIVALARPQKTESETSVRASGVDIVIAIDLSGSMESEDFELAAQLRDQLKVTE